MEYQKPKRKCGRYFQIITIKSVKLISKVDKQGQPEIIDERWIDNEDEYLECKKCRRIYEIIYDDYYPCGGANDFKYAFNTIKDINFEEHSIYDDNVNVLDLFSMEKFELDIYSEMPKEYDFKNENELKLNIVRKWIQENFE